MKAVRPILLCIFMLVLALAADLGVAGTSPTFAIGNRVWFDTDNSGTINGAEVGIDGVAVNLYAAGNLSSILATTATANGGYYLFSGLPAGDYVVSIAASNFAGVLSGYWSSGTSRTDAGVVIETAAPLANSDIDSDDNGTLQTSGTLNGAVTSSVITLGPALTTEPAGELDLFNGNQGGPDTQGNMTVDFGFYTMGLGNLVWNDLDNNGLFDGAEAGIDNVTVELWSADGSTMVAPATTTSGGGSYTFTGLPAGNYIVRLPASNFNPGGILRDYRSSTGPLPAIAYEPAPDPDSNTTDSDDNGTETNGLLGLGGYIQSAPVTLTPGAEQTSSNATGTTTENRVDLGVNNSPQIDLVVTINDGQSTYTPAGMLNYVVVITNNGPADANGVSVSAIRPAQIASWTWTCAASTPPGYNCTNSAGNPATFTDSLDLPQLGSLTYNVSAQVAPGANGNLTASVTASPPVGMTDLTPLDNTASDTDTRIAQLDISVTKTNNQATYAPGATLNYVITVTNNGPGDANGVLVSDTRPAQIASWTWACAAGTPVAYNCTGDAGNPATFTDSLDLPHLASVTYQVTAQVATIVSGDLTNTVTVTAPAGFTDPTPANNTASDIDTLAATTLSIVKSAQPNPVKAGDLLTYTVDVSNTGAGNVSGVTVTDTLPAGVVFQNVAGSGWNCGFAAGIVTCTRDLLAPGAAPSIVITVNVMNASSLTNTAVVSAANAPTATASVQTTVIVPQIPALADWALLLLGLALAGVAGRRLRRG